MRILFVDNHPEFTALVTQSLLHDHEVVIVPTIVAARTVALESRFDVALVDYDLDDGKGVDFVRWVRAGNLPLPLIAVSARREGNEALIAAGADEVCGKLDFARIRDVLGRFWKT